MNETKVQQQHNHGLTYITLWYQLCY